MCHLMVPLILFIINIPPLLALDKTGIVVNIQGKVLREPVQKKKTIKKLFSNESFMATESEEELKLGEEIFFGDKIRTEEKSLLKIKMNHNTMLTLGPKSKMEIKSEETNLHSGILRTLIPHGNLDKIKLTTPHAAMGIRGTEFITQVKEGKTIVALLTGSLDINQGGENRELLKKHSIQISQKGFGELKPLSDALVFLLLKNSIDDNLDLENLPPTETKPELTNNEPQLRKSFRPKNWQEILNENQQE